MGNTSSSESCDVKKHCPSSSDGSYELNSNVDVTPSIPSPSPVVVLEPQQKRPTSSDSNEGGSGEADVKLSKIVSEASTGQRKANGGRGKFGSNTDDTYPKVPPGFEGLKRDAMGFGPVSKRPKTASGFKHSRRRPEDMFRRIFSEKDEIVLIQCMISYRWDKKADPFEDVNAFHEFVKPNLQSDPTVHQLLYKMRKIKTKYQKNKRKEESGRQARTLSSHEQLAYEFSKLVNWSKGGKGRKLVTTPKPAANGIEAAANRMEATPKGMEVILKPVAPKGMEATPKAAAPKGKEATQAEKTNAEVNKGKTPIEKAKAGGNKGKTQVGTTNTGGKDVEIPVEKANAGRNEASMNGFIPDITEIVTWNQAKMDSIGVRMFEGEKRVEGEAEWQKLKMKENKMYWNKLDLIGDKAKLIGRGLKNEYYG